MEECLTQFFQTLPLPNNRYFGSYDMRLVTLSYLVAVFASYIALDMVGRLRDKNNTYRSSMLWLLGGAIAMGSGIWSMHFIGMLSFHIPGLILQYDLFWTGISLLVAILASGFALYLLKKSIINVIHLIAGGVILGFAIASMHYTGMEGMLITLNIRYLPSLFLLSILVAILASEAAIWLALKSNRVIVRLRSRIKFGSAIIMGIAICGMHYTGMAASVFTPLCSPVLNAGENLDPTILSMAIASVTLMILSIAFFASNYKEAMNQQQFEQARQLGMAEISASVLHSVGNVLNSVNVSANTIAEKLLSSKLDNLDKLSVLLNEHKDDLPTFLTNDPRGTKVLDYITTLAKHQHEEHERLSAEIKNVINNTETIRDIISAQQTFSKNGEIDYIISVNELLDETILITGLNLKSEITLIKNYEKITPIVIDKVKLLQIFVNLLTNAKDAVLLSPNDNKTISITTYVKNNMIVVEVKDNGMGILPENLTKIFYHGFTTKEAGHGFGLHTSALVIHEMGGDIQAESEGANKGAVFKLSIPCRIPK
jgi:NO-binding membrane sensor protein with MHYT domain